MMPSWISLQSRSGTIPAHMMSLWRWSRLYVTAWLPAPPHPPSVDAMEIDPVAGDVVQFEDDDDEEYIEEARRPYQSRMTLKEDLRKRNAADKAAGQCHGDVGLSVDGLTTIVDVAVGDATAPSYRQPPLRTPLRPRMPQPRAPPLPNRSTRSRAEAGRR